MTTTYGNLVNDVLLNLSGYTLRQDRATHLTGNITTSSTTLNLASVSNIGKGIVEIDDELIWIDTYDRVSSTATIPPYGRGYNGSSAAVHTADTKVTIAPYFPKTVVKKAINDTIDAVFPKLFAIGTTSFTLVATQTAYSLPADTETILSVTWSTTGPSREWLPVKSWRHDPMTNLTSFATGNSISVYDAITPGRTVQIYYVKKPTTLTASTSTDIFETVTGLPSSCKDVILYGAAYRLASFIDPGRLSYTSAEADQTDTKIQYGSGASTARFLLSLYAQRLTEESEKLRDVYPTKIHYTRY